MKYVEVSPEIFKEFLAGAPFGHKEGDFNVAISEADWTRLRNYFGVPQSVHHSVTIQRWKGYEINPKTLKPYEAHPGEYFIPEVDNENDTP